jgi:hypothetical protein
LSDGQWLWWCWYRGVTVKCRFLFHLKISVFHWHLCNKTNYHTFTYDMYDFVYAIQMVKVSPYHSPCNNNAVSHGGVIIRHYYYMGCDTAKLAAGNFAWNRVFSFSQLFWFKKKKKNSSEIHVFQSDQFSLLMYRCLLPSSVTVKMDYEENMEMLVMQRIMTLLYEPKIESSCVV